MLQKLALMISEDGEERMCDEKMSASVGTQARNQEGQNPHEKIFAPPGKNCWTLFKTMEQSLKIRASLRKLFPLPSAPS